MSHTLVSDRTGGSPKRKTLHDGKSITASGSRPNDLFDRILIADRWPEVFASVLAISGLLACILAGFHPRTWQASASDFKTLFASADCFRRGVSPYSFPQIAAVFESNHVIQPTSWFAHSPVYPPFTLAVIAPLTALPMVPAIYLWTALTALACAAAVFALTRLGDRAFLLSRPWRFLLIALFAASPLLSFGLELGNVSILVGALCILAVASSDYATRRPSGTYVLSAVALALGLLLKTHLALWVVVGLLISRSHRDRQLALRSIAVSAVAVIAVFAWLAAHHQLLPQIAAFRAMVLDELHSGSMRPNARNLEANSAEITSFASLLGFVLRGHVLQLFNTIGLVLAAAALIALSLIDTTRQSGTRLLRIAAWSLFGLIATYHRAHDAFFLMVLLPYAVARLRTCWTAPFAWLFLPLLMLLGFGAGWDTLGWLATKPGLWHIANFILYRQAPLAAVLLLIVVAVETWQRIHREQHVPVDQYDQHSLELAA
jgi:hypothetical protein